jgi:anhydro-N-acetylmuramic acid kinase
MPKRHRIVLGLNSGTSADGIDAVACDIRGRGTAQRVEVIGALHRAYSRGLRRRLLAVMAPAETRTETLCRLDRDVGLEFAMAAARLVKAIGLKRVDLAGSHGQTVCHLPPGRARRSAGVGATLQIGDAAPLALRLGCPVVHQFRQADMAAGGQGAPLVPWTDFVLFGRHRINRIVQNIGGIANLTWLAAGGRLDDVVAFDTGPGNMLIDGLVRRFSHGRESFDRFGRRADRGRLDAKLSAAMQRHRFLGIRPPKSCGREEFGDAWLGELFRRHGGRKIRGDDWIATATDFSAAAMVYAYENYLPLPRRGRPAVEEIILCGGGARNHALVAMLAGYLNFNQQFAGAAIRTTEDYGIPLLAKESVSFAMMAAARVDGIAVNLPRVTGARRRVVLGQICDPDGAR